MVISVSTLPKQKLKSWLAKIVHVQCNRNHKNKGKFMTLAEKLSGPHIVRQSQRDGMGSSGWGEKLRLSAYCCSRYSILAGVVSSEIKINLMFLFFDDADDDDAFLPYHIHICVIYAGKHLEHKQEKASSMVQSSQVKLYSLAASRFMSGANSINFNRTPVVLRIRHWYRWIVREEIHPFHFILFDPLSKMLQLLHAPFVP